jgi:hypothetical protein
MKLKRFLFFILGFILYELIFADGAWAWGPAVHTAIGCSILENLGQLMPAIAGIIQSYPMEYLYGCLSADFYVGKGQKKRNGHSHNWDVGLRFMDRANDEREAAYAYGFMSHLAADVAAHNYFVPNLIQKAPTWKRTGHLFFEAKADRFVGSPYLKMARDILSIDRLECDDLLIGAVGKKNGIKTRRQIFTQSVKVSDFFNGSPLLLLEQKGSRHAVSYEYLTFMINLAYRLVKDVLSNLDASPCLSFDPIGSHNLRQARRNGIMSIIFNNPDHMALFSVDPKLLRL